MGNKILYVILFCWVKIHAILPMRVLYLLSDILYFIAYRLLHYRVKVTRMNLKNAFPEKSDEERLQLEHRFYHHFTDYIVETIKLAHISEEEIKRRAYITNPELIDQLMDKGHNTMVLLMGHYGNWEWYTGSTSFFRDAKIYQIYRPLNNKAVDKLFIFLRTRFGSSGIPKADAVRETFKLKRAKAKALIIFIADQTPSKANLHYWTQFLHQDSSILTGPERLAVKMKLPVIFLDVSQVKRGYYSIDMKLITEHPEETAEYEITEKYARMMEQSILRDPAYWLWTHKRWKHKRPVDTNRENK